MEHMFTIGTIVDLCNRGHRYNGLHKDYHGDPADKEMEAVSGVEEDGEECEREGERVSGGKRTIGRDKARHNGPGLVRVSLVTTK